MLKNNCFAGIQIQKKLIPKDYVFNFGIDNLWKVNLTKNWRFLYSVRDGEILIMSIIIDWMDHKNYERKFKY